MGEKELEIEELALEVIDMLGVALHFAGGKNIRALIDLYLEELEHVPENIAYDQKQMIALIERLRHKYPQHFGH